MVNSAAFVKNQLGARRKAQKEREYMYIYICVCVCVCVWLIHDVVQQKLTQHCEANIFQ